AVKQQNLFWLIPDSLYCELLRVGKNLVTIRKVTAREIVLQRGVSTFLGIFVDAGVHPVRGVKGDGGDAITASHQKRFGLTPRLKIAAGVQKRMAEVSELHAMFGEQQFCDALALHHVIFPRLQSHLVQGRMAVGVIAQLEAVVKPHAECLDALIDFGELVKLSFVDESDYRYFLVTERGQQLR